MTKREKDKLNRRFKKLEESIKDNDMQFIVFFEYGGEIKLGGRFSKSMAVACIRDLSDFILTRFNKEINDSEK